MSGHQGLLGGRFSYGWEWGSPDAESPGNSGKGITRGERQIQWGSWERNVDAFPRTEVQVCHVEGKQRCAHLSQGCSQTTHSTDLEQQEAPLGCRSSRGLTQARAPDGVSLSGGSGRPPHHQHHGCKNKDQVSGPNSHLVPSPPDRSLLWGLPRHWTKEP